MTAAVVINSEANILMNAGMFVSGLTVSYEQLALDNEMLGWLFHLRRDRGFPGDSCDRTDQASRAGRSFPTWRFAVCNWTPKGRVLDTDSFMQAGI